MGKPLFPLAIVASHSTSCFSSIVCNKSRQLGFIFIHSEFYFLISLI